jgi:predicted nucleotidyltransferase
MEQIKLGEKNSTDININTNRSENLSPRLQIQIEKFEKYKPEILKLIKRYEEEYNVVMFYAAEIGSRGLGTDVEDSDFDISGFFIPKDEMEYFKIIKKVGNTIKLDKIKLQLDGKFYDVDFDFWDIKEWLRSKVTKNSTGCDFWFESPLIYINLFPEIINEVRKYIIPPFLLYWGKAKSGIQYNEKDLTNSDKCKTKSLMNVLTSLFQYFHYQIYLNFPIYNILDEIDFLIKNKDDIISQGIYDTEEFKIFEKSTEIYFELFEEKKKTRKNLRTKIPEEIYQLMNLIQGKFNVHKKKYELEILIKEDKAQEIFDEILALIKNITID